MPRYGQRGPSEAEIEEWRAQDTKRRITILDQLIEMLELDANPVAPAEKVMGHSDHVFIVHGHNKQITDQAARFLEKLDLDVTILSEQPSRGQTIIEKFEGNSDVGFAVVLLTGDDRGGTLAVPCDKQQPRARQNVILELGYFLAKLGRKRVCALYQEGVEIPSDCGSVLFVPLDNSGAWRMTLGREMKAAGLPIDMNKAL